MSGSQQLIGIDQVALCSLSGDVGFTASVIGVDVGGLQVVVAIVFLIWNPSCY